MKKTTRLTIAAAVLAVSSTGALSQSFPAKPIRILVGFATGTTMVSGHLIADDMGKRLGQPIIVEPMPGANGIIVTNAVIKSPPDGYTLLYGSAMTPSPLFNKNNPIDLPKSLVTISHLVSSPYAFYMSAKLPVNSLQELIAWSKANPGKLNFASATPAFALLAEGLKTRTGLDYFDIRYKGTDFTINATISGEVGLAASVLTGWSAHAAAGTVKPLFIMTAQRSELWRELPTAAELGIKDFVAGVNFGLWAPLGTPRDIVQKLNLAAVAAVTSPQVATRLRSQAIGGEPIGSSPEEHLRMVENEIRFWSELVRVSRFQPE